VRAVGKSFKPEYPVNNAYSAKVGTGFCEQNTRKFNFGGLFRQIRAGIVKQAPETKMSAANTPFI
jgi:hypothetical protein